MPRWKGGMGAVASNKNFMTRKSHILGVLTLALIAATIAVLSLYAFQAEAGTSSLTSYPCTVVTSTSSSVGNQVSRQVLASSSRRAWARIEQPVNATNTVAISIAGDAAAVIGQGVQLTPATSTNPVVVFDFGLNTDLPYTGAIQAITNTGTTSVTVSQCIY